MGEQWVDQGSKLSEYYAVKYKKWFPVSLLFAHWGPDEWLSYLLSMWFWAWLQVLRSRNIFWWVKWSVKWFSYWVVNVMLSNGVEIRSDAPARRWKQRCKLHFKEASGRTTFSKQFPCNDYLFDQTHSNEVLVQPSKALRSVWNDPHECALVSKISLRDALCCCA